MIKLVLSIRCKTVEQAQGILIRVARGKRSQQAVADAAGITTQKLSRIENGCGADSITMAKIELALGFERGAIAYLDTEIIIEIK